MKPTDNNGMSGTFRLDANNIDAVSASAAQSYSLHPRCGSAGALSESCAAFDQMLSAKAAELQPDAGPV